MTTTITDQQTQIYAMHIELLGHMCMQAHKEALVYTLFNMSLTCKWCKCLAGKDFHLEKEQNMSLSKQQKQTTTTLTY